MPRHPYNIHVAFKSSLDTYFFKAAIQMNHLFETRGELSKQDFKQSWNQSKASKVYPAMPAPASSSNLDQFAKLLRLNNMYVVQKKSQADGGGQVYVSVRSATGHLGYYCVTVDQEGLMEVEVRSEDGEVLDLMYHGLLFVIN